MTIPHAPPPRSLFSHFIKSVYEGAGCAIATIGCLTLIIALGALVSILTLIAGLLSL